jgi:hypothetical protein
MKKVLILISIIVIIANSCGRGSGFLGQREAVFARYKLVYDHAKYQTTASTEFFQYSENGQKLNLHVSLKPIIRYNNSTSLIEYSQKDWMYYRVFDGKVNTITSSYQYTYQIQPYTNTLQLPSAISFPSGFNSLVKANGLTLTFNGNAIDQNEKVVLQIGDLTFENSKVGSNTFELTAQDLQKLPTGNLTATLTRIKRLDATEASPAGGVKQTEYKSGEKIIAVM